MCRSDPQIAVVVTLTMASRGLRMIGSGTVSTWMVLFAFPADGSHESLLCVGRRSRNLAGLEQLLEVTQILADGLRRFATEE